MTPTTEIRNGWVIDKPAHPQPDIPLTFVIFFIIILTGVLLYRGQRK